GVGGRGEDRHHPIAEPLQLGAAVCREGVLQQAAVPAQDALRLLVAHPLEHRGGAHQVGEQDRDRTSGHRPASYHSGSLRGNRAVLTNGRGRGLQDTSGGGLGSLTADASPYRLQHELCRIVSGAEGSRTPDLYSAILLVPVTPADHAHPQMLRMTSSPTRSCRPLWSFVCRRTRREAAEPPCSMPESP